MYKVKTLIVCISLLIGQKMFAQDGALQAVLPQVVPASPSSASFSKFGNYQVNLFTGLPDITVPLYEIKVGELTIPISISYHASGIKVTDWSNWVGLGWALNAGGSVTRTVMGLPDESITGYLYKTGYKNVSDINLGTDAGYMYLNSVYQNTADAEPDVFSYNFPGKSGKFVFNDQDNFNAVMLPYDPIIVNPNLNSHFMKFAITDERGVKYQFDSTEITLNDNPSLTSVSSWLLSKVYSANKQDSIMLKYAKRTGYSSQVSFDNTDYIVLNDKILYNGNACSTNPYGAADLGNGYTSANGYFVGEKMINEISFRGGKVVFDTSVSDRLDGYAGQKKLAGIKVYNYNAVANSYSLIKTIYFYQSYFNPSGSQEEKRLRLDSIGIAGSDGVVIEKYKFNYNSTITVPNKTSRSRDFWGYYNGKSNTSLVPFTDSIEYQSTPYSGVGYVSISSGNSRDADSNYMQMAMLKSIYFPTGGHTDFTFETNKCYDGASVKYAGGLRVASIKSYDGISSTPIVKTYKYGKGESGVGRGNYILPYHFNSVSQTFRYFDYQKDALCHPLSVCEIQIASKRTRTYYSTPTVAEAPYDLAPVVYDTVTEYTGDNVTNIGKTVYVFTDHPDGLSTTMLLNKPVVTSYYMDRGHLADKTDYVHKSGYYTKVHQTQNLYGAYSENFYTNIGLVAFKTTITQDPVGNDIPLGHYYSGDCWDDANHYNFMNYSIRTADTKLKQTIDSTFDQNDSTKVYTTKVNYYYDSFSHQQLTRVYTVNSKGDSIKIFKQYPSDKGATAPYNTMTSLHIINKEVQEKQYNNTTQLVQTNNNFQDMSNGNYLPANISQQITSNPAETRIYFNQYDNQGNILEMQKASDEKTSIIWDFKKIYPIAKAENAKYADIAHTSFESDGKGNWTFSGTPTSDVTAPTGKYAYNLSGGSLKKTGLTSALTYIISYWSKTNDPYTVSHSGSVKEGKTIDGWTYFEHTVTGVTGDTISGGGLIDEVRLYPSTAQMTTFTYTPLVGMTSQCDINNRITYYTYDSYNRLSYVRDQDKNVIKKICYNYYNQPDACANTLFYNVAKSGTYSRNNCTGGYVGSSVTYNVPESTYHASSQAAADLLAQNDVNANGQSYANSHGTCSPPPDITITSLNYIGQTGWTAQFITGISTVVATFSIPSTGGTLGTVPQGTYRIIISKTGGNSTTYFFSVCSTGGTTGTSAAFTGIAVNSSACNQVTISPLD